MARRELHHAASHLVAAEQMADPMAGHELDGGARLEGVHDHRGSARRQCAEHEVEAEHAAERDRGQHPAVRRLEPEAAGDRTRVIGDRSLRMHHELRALGGAGRGEQRDDRFGIGAIRRCGKGTLERIERDGRLAEHPLRDRRARADHRDLLERLRRRDIDLGQDRRKIDFLERGFDDQHARPGAAQHVFELARPEARVDGDQRRADAGEPEQQRQPLDPVHQPDRNPVAGAHALRGQPSGGLAAKRVEFGVGDAFLDVDAGGRVRALGEMPVEQCRKGQPVAVRHGSGPRRRRVTSSGTPVI